MVLGGDILISPIFKTVRSYAKMSHSCKKSTLQLISPYYFWLICFSVLHCTPYCINSMPLGHLLLPLNFLLIFAGSDLY